MGMSASQARFLALTARKSNVEFQGQQVNQQRTSLANESAGLFNQMLELQVPTPPSATDFYSMAYTFPGDNENEEYRILNWGAASDPTKGMYNVDVKIVNKDSGYKNPSLEVGTSIKLSNGEYSIQLPNTTDGVAMTKSDKDVRGRTQGEDGYVPSYSYKYGGRTYYIEEETLANMFDPIAETNGMKEYIVTQENQANSTVAYYKSENSMREVTLYNATMDSAETGRFTAITYYPNYPESLETRTIDLVIQEINDDAGYDAAMAEYNYKKMLYDRTIDDINTRTEVIQRQDLTLELNLKQLDTEQEALNKEMEAVQQVINKNVETTFKTFG